MLKNMWRQIVLRNVRYADNYAKLNTFYMLNDPWHMDTPIQKYRFIETNRLIARNFGRVGSILEIGCGEGHQSLYLREVCDRLIGLDVSDRAIKRVRRRCPGGEFLVGDIFSDEVLAHAPFDLVVACEVLYYMKDVNVAIERMRALGRHTFVTYYNGQIERLDPYVLSRPEVASEILESEHGRWRVAWWHS